MSVVHSRFATVSAIVAFALAVTVCAGAQVLPVSHGNSTYMLEYDAGSRTLQCSSNNINCVWRTTVSNQIDSFRDFAAVGTAAGPVVVYSEGNQTRFVLLHFRTGSTNVENSGESLRGVIGPGWMLNCVMQSAQYGAKAVCQTVVGSTIHEYRWDINMWGTHQKLAGDTNAGTYSAGTAVQSQAYSDPARRFTMDIPRGFRFAPQDDSSVALYGPTNDVFLTVFSDAGATPIAELGDAYMAELGVEVTHRSNEALANGQPALLLMGNGTVNGIPSLHVGLFFSTDQRTYVLSYTGRSDVADTYVPAFMEAIDSFGPM